MENKKEEYTQLLKENVCRVLFEKVDGTMRTMYCTLNETELPVTEDFSNRRSKSEKTICVYDVEKNDWRSFRIDSVKEFEACEIYERSQANV